MKNPYLIQSKSYDLYAGQQYRSIPITNDIQTELEITKQWQNAVRQQKLPDILTSLTTNLAELIDKTNVSTIRYIGILPINDSDIEYALGYCDPDFITDDSTITNYLQVKIVQNKLQIAFIKTEAAFHTIRVKFNNLIVLDANVTAATWLQKMVLDTMHSTKINKIIPGVWIEQALALNQTFRNYAIAQMNQNIEPYPLIDKASLAY